jgi:nucleotidyltransferase substrate binding protein (TIGR01987 family)
MIILSEINITPLLKAEYTLREVLVQPKSAFMRDAAIQRFAYCFELAWKTMKRILAYRGLEANSPREVFRLAAKDSLILNPELWFEYLSKRNLTTHTYNETIAEEIYAILPQFSDDLSAFINTIKCL